MHGEDCSLNTFKMITSTNELMKEFIKQKLVIFRWHQLDLNDISVYYNGGRSIKSMFFYCCLYCLPNPKHCGLQINFFWGLIIILINLRKYL
jgi:hypothetical protein